jgi:hypothetical protein
MRSLALVLALLATPVAAQELGQVDYPALFAAHADRVRQATPGQYVLELPGPVIVTRYEGAPPRYKAQDQSGHGALLCQYDALLESVVITQLCPDLIDPPKAQALSAALVELAVVIGANSLPVLNETQAQAALQSALIAQQKRFGGQVCPQRDQARALVATLETRAKPHVLRRLKRGLARPRLPVKHPCP